MKKEDLFRETIKECDNMILRVCYNFFGPGEDADDAHQEVLLKIWLNLEKFRNESSIKTWIYRIAVNVCITFSAGIKKRLKLFVPITDRLWGIKDEDKIKDDDEKVVFMRKFIDRLNVTEKTIVSLYLEDLSTKEISEITGLSEVNVRVKIHRIKNEIRKEWQLKYGT